MIALLGCVASEHSEPTPVVTVPDVDTTWEELPDAPEDTGPYGEEVPPRVPDVVVDCEGGGDYTTIGAAIAGSTSGTAIGLRPCTYLEDVDFNGKSLDIFGIDGSAVTFIQGSGTGAVVKANHGESVGTRLAGVTVSGGATVGYHGSGLSTDLAILQLEDVVFTGNDVGRSVVYSTASFLEFLDVSFLDNTVDPGDGLLLFDDGSLVAQRLEVRCTDAVFAIFQHNAMLLLDSDLRCGTEHGVYSDGSGAHIQRSRIQSAGVAIYSADVDDTRNERLWLSNSSFIGETAAYALYTHVKADNNVFWGEQVGFDLQYVHADSFVRGSVLTGATCGLRADASYDLGWNADSGAGCGAVTRDGVTGAGFVAAPEDFTLLADSPLIDAGDPDDDRDDVDGTRNDVGMFGGPGAFWP